MMRKKELKLVLTFHTTADAMAMEKAERPGTADPRPQGDLRRLRPGLVRRA